MNNELKIFKNLEKLKIKFSINIYRFPIIINKFIKEIEKKKEKYIEGIFHKKNRFSISEIKKKINIEKYIKKIKIFFYRTKLLNKNKNKINLIRRKISILIIKDKLESKIINFFKKIKRKVKKNNLKKYLKTKKKIKKILKLNKIKKKFFIKNIIRKNKIKFKKIIINKKKFYIKNYLKYIKKVEKIIKKIKKIKKKIIKKNIKLVISFVNNKNNKNNEDLIQEGILGLIKSINKFDYRKGFKFSTYSTWWIKQSINKAVRSKKIIKVPYNINNMLYKIKKFIKKYEKKNFNKPSIKKISNFFSITKKKTIRILNSQKEIVSLNKKINDDNEGYEIEETISSKEESVFEKVKKIEEKINIKSSLKKLNKKERKIIKMRFGLFGYKKKTLEKIGKIFNVTRERIRQIELNSINKLKKSKYVNNILKCYKGR